MFEYNPSELDRDTAVAHMNKLAREHPQGEGLQVVAPNEIDGDEFSPEHFAYYQSLTEPIGEAISNRVIELFEGTTFLSEEEAHVVALKELGLTHNAISTYYSLTAETAAKSTVDEYSRRARQKYLKAKRTADELAPLYGGDE
jgi:hypothetical protein